MDPVPRFIRPLTNAASMNSRHWLEEITNVCLWNGAMRIKKSNFLKHLPGRLTTIADMFNPLHSRCVISLRLFSM
ncbi:hypothetical protein I7I53_09800 [Histoplasma capsulatum var. duboisii H88]|uniref:Uncharacterized protein n=1 Tax=Ajellomyces capsulatus (strain H88) TaxID=544711 RepID=A0A8A1LBP7_AJEC8|nr:hypothetical protein I7I53_09800 [Histoplasma capsulatum var. duboisii H88]